MAEVYNKNKVGRFITKGSHYEIREYDKDRVVKTPLPRAVRYAGPLQAKEHYLLLRRYVGDYLPQTEFISGKRHKQPLVIQERIKGRILRNMKWEEIRKSKKLHKHLLKLIKGIIKLEKETGKTVELFGKGKRWQRSHPKNTDNIIVDRREKPFLIDVFLLDPKEIKLKWWELRRRWFLWFLRRGLRNMEKKLESLSS